MNEDQSFMAGSSFHAGSFTSFKKDVEITPAEFTSPAGLSAVAIDAAVSFRMNTGCQLRSAAIRITFAAFAGTPAKTKISAPDLFRMDTWVSSDSSEISY